MSSRERIVVTGAAGFIGSNLCSMLLDEGYAVTAIDNLSAGTFENLPVGVDFHKADICDADLQSLFSGASTVFHLAAKNCLADCAANPVETTKINVVGTTRVLEAAVQAKVPHLIYADTSAEYEGILDFPSKITETRPLSVYACAKKGGALMAEAFAQLHPIKVSFVRYFNVYGRAQDWRRVIPPVMSAFTTRLLEGKRPVIYGTGEKSRDFIHVDDVNSFHLMLVREPAIQGGTYNLGSGKDHTVLDIFEKIEGIIGSGIAPEFKPELPAEAFRTLGDISETVKTGWRPRVSLDEGLRDFVDYTRERLSREPKAH